MISRRILRVGAAVLCLTLPAGCALFRPRPPQQLEISSPVAAIAERVCAQARDVEPQTTALLKSVGPKTGATLVGLEDRLKKESSTARKIQTALAENPDLAPRDVVVYDALRYRMLVTDKPRGEYLRAIRFTIRQLETNGYRIVEVRNYWPRGDSYSAVHVIAEAPNGLQWELQFHTPRSLAAANRGRRLYERMRLPTTPLEERQALFDQLAEIWENVPVPDGILEPGAIHPTEVIRTRPRPEALPEP